MIAAGHSRDQIDNYTLAQCELFLRESARNDKRQAALIAQFTVAAAFDSETWKKLIKDI